MTICLGTKLLLRRRTKLLLRRRVSPVSYFVFQIPQDRLLGSVIPNVLLLIFELRSNIDLCSAPLCIDGPIFRCLNRSLVAVSVREEYRAICSCVPCSERITLGGSSGGYLQANLYYRACRCLVYPIHAATRGPIFGPRHHRKIGFGASLGYRACDQFNP